MTETDPSSVVSSPQPQAVQLAQGVAAQLARHVTDVVICPGSRNAPLNLALLQRPDVRVHTRIDERSAAFLALGMARVQHRHVAVVMTSGTAVANTYPALIEAVYSHTPLAIVSADRPERLVGTGAPQTIEQQGIFGPYAATTHVSDVEDIPTMADRFFTDNAIHINVALDVPLVGEDLPQIPTDITMHRAPAPRAGSGRPPFADHGTVDVDLRRNTLVIAGDEAWSVPGLEDVPTIAEPSAPAPYRPVHPAAAGFFRKDHVSANDYVVKTKVEQVIVVGHPTLHRQVLALLSDPDIDLICLSQTKDVTNPRGDKAVVGTHVRTTGEPTREWIKVCEGMALMAGQAVRETLANPDFGFTGVHVAAAVGDTLAVGDCVVWGASNAVRDASLVGLPFDGVEAYSPRGAAGIDGTVAQAIGVALATQSREADAWRAPRTVAVMGDVTFFHDASSLSIGEDNVRPENLTIVVGNDRGGGIFETLETGVDNLRPLFERAFGTPQNVDIEQLVGAYGARYRKAESAQELLDILAELKEESTGITVVEARTTRETRRALHAELTGKTGV